MAKRGSHISFLGFMKVAFPLMIMSIIVSTGYLLFWYYYPGVISLLGTLAVGAIIALLLAPISKKLEAQGEQAKTGIDQ